MISNIFDRFRPNATQGRYSPSDVIAAFQYYLGRYPEDQAAFDWHQEKTGGKLDRLREIFGNSDEFRQGISNPTRSSIGTFFAPRTNAPKICVLGNCQGPNIAMAISAISKQAVSVCGLEIMDVSNRLNEFERIIADSDYVVACQVFNEKYRPLSPDAIRKKFGKPVLEYSPVHFTGLHPDMLVLGNYGQRIRSPLGDYNSRIVLSAFVNGLSQAQTVEQFNRSVYARAHYFEEFEWSTKVMTEREGKFAGENGITIADWFLPEVLRAPLLFTINHPNSRVFERFARLILDRVGVERHDVPSELIPNALASGAIWPVDPIIAEANGASYSTKLTYWANNVPLPLDEFIWRSFQAYEQLGTEVLGEAMGAAVIEM